MLGILPRKASKTHACILTTLAGTMADDEAAYSAVVCDNGSGVVKVRKLESSPYGAFVLPTNTKVYTDSAYPRIALCPHIVGWICGRGSSQRGIPQHCGPAQAPEHHGWYGTKGACNGGSLCTDFTSSRELKK